MACSGSETLEEFKITAIDIADQMSAVLHPLRFDGETDDRDAVNRRSRPAICAE
jgi:hypothetical protein